jgi:pyrrolidone-carboxylate peptidase
MAAAQPQPLPSMSLDTMRRAVEIAIYVAVSE